MVLRPSLDELCLEEDFGRHHVPAAPASAYLNLIGSYFSQFTRMHARPNKITCVAGMRGRCCQTCHGPVTSKCRNLRGTGVPCCATSPLSPAPPRPWDPPAALHPRDPSGCLRLARIQKFSAVLPRRRWSNPYDWSMCWIYPSQKSWSVFSPSDIVESI